VRNSPPEGRLSILLVGALALGVAAGWVPAGAQQAAAPSLTDGVQVRPIDPGTVALPSEAVSARERRFSFIVYGDTRGPADGVTLQPQHGDVVDTMIATIREQQSSGFPVRFVVQSGDAVTNGRYGRQWNVSFNPIVERLIRDGGVAYWFAVGNHDVGPSPDIKDEGRRIGLRNTEAAMSRLWPSNASPRRMPGYPTYAFAYGQYFFIVLDSDIASDVAQRTWVAAQLEGLNRTRYPHVVAVFHHPPLSSGPHGGEIVEPQTDAMRRDYMPLFRQYHVRLLLTGHDHLFDHYVERYQDVSGSHRIDHIVTGGGGAPIYPYTAEPDLARYAGTAAPLNITVEHAARPSPDVADNPHHFALIQVDNDMLSLRVVATVAAPFEPYGSKKTMSLGPDLSPTRTGR